ncbi:MAG: ATP-binding protein, partial [Mobilitalea sp.]
GGILYEDQIQTVLFFLMMLVVLFFTAFMGQNIFLNGTNDYSQVNYQGATYDFFSCILVLVVQYSIFRISTLNREKEIVKQLLYERQKQYKLSKENIDMINHKCHDLKHQIQALKEAKGEELDKYINEVEDSIMIYDTVVKTENEVLNTILSEKSLYCEKHHIHLTCIVDANQLDFMSTLDIYVLLGNALDNAIECVSKHQDKEKRVISLTISANGSFLCIQTNNYYEGDMLILDGIPETTKKNQDYHGFGMKSMKHLAEKYGGTLYTNLENGIFMLQIVIPIPKEFTRLLKEAGNMF